jgi:hypothetical protein
MPLPEINHCILCEDIRLEQRNLASFMGVYGLTPYAGISIQDFKLPVAFCLVFFAPPIEGKIDILLEIRARNGTRLQATIFPERNEQTFSKESACTFAFRVNTVFPTPDTYTIAVSTGGQEFFRDTFLMAQGK